MGGRATELRSDGALGLRGIGWDRTMIRWRPMRSAAMIVIALVAACGAVTDPGLPDAGGGETIYRGVLDEMAPVTFGGGQFCRYSIALREIEIQVTVQASGLVIGAEARNVNVEMVVPPCPFAPQAPSIATYAFASASAASGEVVVALSPASTNTPVGTLRLHLVRTGDAYLARFEYHRTDQVPPLDWSVAGSLALAPQPQL